MRVHSLVATLTLGILPLFTTASAQQPAIVVMKDRGGAFGLAMGMTAQEVRNAVGDDAFVPTPNNGANSYSLRSVPFPDDGFVQFSVVITPTKGLCHIAARTESIVTAVDGRAVRAAFDQLVSRMRGRYPHVTVRDSAERDAPAAKSWMESLALRNRRLSAMGVDRSSGVAMWLNAMAVDESHGFLMVWYRLSNDDGCSPGAVPAPAVMASPQVERPPLMRNQVLQPFGLRMGMSLSDIRRLAHVVRDSSKPHYFWITRVPKPHPEFSRLLAIITPKQGLCYVSAVGGDIDDNERGDALGTKFLEVQRALRERYGEPTAVEVDGLASDSLPRRRLRWMKESGTAITVSWESEAGAQVDLRGWAENENTSYVTLQYSSPSYASCFNEAKRAANAGL